MVPIWLVSVTLGFGVQTSCPTTASNRARDRYAQGEYSAAIAALADVDVCTDGSDEELAEAFRWRAQAKAANGDTAGAVEAWALVWTVLPTYALDPLESPKFHEEYARGRTLAATTRVVFARLVRSVVGYVVVQVFDPTGRVKRAAIQFDQMEMNATRQDDGTWRALIPEGASSASVVLESGDAIVFRSMKVSVAELPVPVEERTAAAPAPLFTDRQWLIVGGAAAGAVVLAIVLGSVAASTKHVDGSLGRIELP
jgi:hypothetical protein